MVVALAKANDDDTTLPHVAVDASVVIATLVLCHEVVTGPDQPLVAAAETPDNVLLCPHLVGGAVSHKDVAPFTLWEWIPATWGGREGWEVWGERENKENEKAR